MFLSVSMSLITINSWEPQANLDRCPEVLRAFWSNIGISESERLIVVRSFLIAQWIMPSDLSLFF
jgi:hypothetical protein